jgi:type II secretory pathway pseudopilin PulG
MFCSKCGASNTDEGRFCANCGTALQGQAGQPSTTTPPVPGLAPPYAGQTETSGKAIASLICGLLFFIFPSAVAAIILGHLSLSDISKSAGRLAGRGMAIVGLVLGYAGILFIPFILIIAAIAIPNLLRARQAANEASAAASIRTINTAALTYSATYSNGFPPDLITLDGVDAGEATCDHAQLIDGVLASGMKSGYLFTYAPSSSGSESPSSQPKPRDCTTPGAATYEVRADPITRGSTGLRSFHSDQTGIIRFERNGPASADSPELGRSQRF